MTEQVVVSAAPVEEPEVAKTADEVIAETEETRPDEELSAEAAEAPAETKQDKEEEDELVVPALVEEYMPGLAGSWSSLTPDQRKVIELDLARGLDQGEPSGKGGDAAKGGEVNEPSAAPPKKPAQEPAPAPRSETQFRLRDMPETITEDEVKAAVDFLDDTDGNVKKLFDKLLARTDFAVKTASELVPLALQAIDETRQSVTTMTDERELGAALERRTPEFRGFTRAQFDQVVDRAKAIRKGGRTRDWGDAVSLALVESKYPTKKDGLTPDKRAEAEKLATSLARTGKSRGRQPQMPDDLTSIADYWEYNKRKLGAPRE